jgi:hypothetical protein
VVFTNESLDGDCVRKVLSDSFTSARMILRIDALALNRVHLTQIRVLLRTLSEGGVMRSIRKRLRSAQQSFGFLHPSHPRGDRSFGLMVWRPALRRCAQAARFRQLSVQRLSV